MFKPILMDFLALLSAARPFINVETEPRTYCCCGGGGSREVDWKNIFGVRLQKTGAGGKVAKIF